MLAQVRQDYRWKTVNAFTGHEYVKYEWRNVPAGMEEQAKKHPDLVVKEGSGQEQEFDTGAARQAKAEQKDYVRGGMPYVRGGMPDVKPVSAEAQSRRPSRRSKKDSDGESEEE